MKRWLSKTIAGFMRRPALTPAQLLDLQPERILIVRQQNQMGDMICATPSFRALREAFPAARIALVTAPVNREVVEHNPHLDQILAFDQKMWRRPTRLWHLLRDMRSFRPDVAFVLASVSFSVTSAALALLSGARYVVGADSRPFGHEVSARAFSLEMPSQPELDEHAVLHSLAPLRGIGIETDDLSTVVAVTPEEEAEARRILGDLALKPGYWALHPGAGKKQNIWPAHGFAEVVRRARAAGHQVLVLHGPADAETLQQLQSHLADGLAEDVKMAPACSIGVGAALLHLADRFLCHDTGVMHMAGALPVPTVALFGPTDPQLWKPPTELVVALCSPRQTPDDRGPEYGWMENITTDSVWNAWRRLPGRSDQEIG